MRRKQEIGRSSIKDAVGRVTIGGVWDGAQLATSDRQSGHRPLIWHTHKEKHLTEKGQSAELAMCWVGGARRVGPFGRRGPASCWIVWVPLPGHRAGLGTET